MKKGFTLIEMIGVMVILSLLLLLVMPNVINYIKKGGDIKDKATKEILYTAAKKYMEDNKEDFKKDKYSTYCIKVNTLSSEGYIDSPMTLSSSDKDITNNNSTTSVKVIYDKKYKYDLVDNCEEKINPTPVLQKGLIPIKYDEENEKWVVADKDKDDWYDYDNQEWANAVTLLPGVTKNVGDEVAVDGTEASMMLVWIPRYEYKIEGDFGKGGESAALPGEIEVNFVLRTKKGYDLVSGYRVHPAFTFGEQEVSGIWVGKFEISHSDQTKSETSMNCTTDTCSEAQYLRVLPNKSSLRSNAVPDFFLGIKSMENTNEFGFSNIDIHMMRDVEWGVVAYLSQSKYGKYGNDDYDKEYKEIYQNKDTDHMTGKSNGTPIQSETNTQYYYDDTTDLGVDSNGKKRGLAGPGASTTGNIYGVYDMNGGAEEYTMGIYGESNGVYSAGKNSELKSGFNGLYSDGGERFDGIDLPNSKYYDKYIIENNHSMCGNEECYGYALYETKQWYTDQFETEEITKAWQVRGGSIVSFNPGIFAVGEYHGIPNFHYSTRPVIISK